MPTEFIDFRDFVLLADEYLEDAHRERKLISDFAGQLSCEALEAHQRHIWQSTERAHKALVTASEHYVRCETGNVCVGSGGEACPEGFYLCDSCSDGEERVERILDGCTCRTGDASDHATGCGWDINNRWAKKG